MDIQFINITSYRGISSNAEHYYARFASENEKELIAEDIFCGYSVATYCNTDMLFFPDREQAIALIKKDNQMTGSPFKENIDDDTIAVYMERGTIRFPSILDIIKQARKQFPQAIFKFYLQGSEDEFRKYWRRRYESGDKETAEQMIDIVCKCQ